MPDKLSVIIHQGPPWFMARHTQMDTKIRKTQPSQVWTFPNFRVGLIVGNLRWGVSLRTVRLSYGRSTNDLALQQKFEPVKELVCFAWGKFTYSENLAFRILAVLYDFAMMLTYAIYADYSYSSYRRKCTITMRKVY